MRSLRWSLWSAVLLLPVPVLAQDSGKVEQRIQSFYFSDPAYLQEPQEWQFLLGTRWHGQDGEGNFTVPLELEFGVSDRLEFDGDVEFSFPQPANGNLRSVDRAEGAVSVSLLDDARRGVAVSAALGFVGSRDPLDNSFDPGGSPKVFAFAQRGDLLANVELSIDLLSRNAALEAEPEAALGLAWDLGRVMPTFEAVYENEDAPAGIFALGLRLKAAKALELGATVPLEVSQGETHVGVAAQLVLSLGGS